MELGAASIGYSRSGRLIMHVNKIHHVTTINRVAKDLGENENWLSDIANEMDIEDGVTHLNMQAHHALARSVRQIPGLEWFHNVVCVLSEPRRCG